MIKGIFIYFPTLAFI